MYTKFHLFLKSSKVLRTPEPGLDRVVLGSCKITRFVTFSGRYKVSLR